MRVIAKALVFFLFLSLLTYFLPAKPIDPWGLFNLKKIASLVLVLGGIQAFGALMIKILGRTSGAILAGFFGGFISSTATTAALAKRSKLRGEFENISSELLVLLAATLAMLLEGMGILFWGMQEFHFSSLVIFLGPASVILGFMVHYSKKANDQTVDSPTDFQFLILPLVKLSAFVFGMLSLSKLLQHLLGKSGLYGMTFLVSLFEIHGSFIANIQLHDQGAFDTKVLATLMAISILASITSKFFLVYTVGSRKLAKEVLKISLILSLVLFLSTAFFNVVAV